MGWLAERPAIVRSQQSADKPGPQPHRDHHDPPSVSHEDRRRPSDAAAGGDGGRGAAGSREYSHVPTAQQRPASSQPQHNEYGGATVVRVSRQRRRQLEEQKRREEGGGHLQEGGGGPGGAVPGAREEEPGPVRQRKDIEGAQQQQAVKPPVVQPLPLERAGQGVRQDGGGVAGDSYDDNDRSSQGSSSIPLTERDRRRLEGELKRRKAQQARLMDALALADAMKAATGLPSERSEYSAQSSAFPWASGRKPSPIAREEPHANPSARQNAELLQEVTDEIAFLEEQLSTGRLLTRRSNTTTNPPSTKERQPPSKSPTGPSRNPSAFPPRPTSPYYPSPRGYGRGAQVVGGSGGGGGGGSPPHLFPATGRSDSSDGSSLREQRLQLRKEQRAARLFEAGIRSFEPQGPSLNAAIRRGSSEQPSSAHRQGVPETQRPASGRDFTQRRNSKRYDPISGRYI